MRALVISGLCLLLQGVSLADGSAKANCERSQLRGLWEPANGTLAVIVSSKFDASMNACLRTLRIVRQQDDQSVEEVYREEMAERPIGIWPLAGRLLTIWGSGSAFWVTAYAVDGTTVEKVLDVRPKGFPEIEFLRNGAERLIFSKYDFREGANGQVEGVPTSADVYTWNGVQYSKKSNVPWAQRFDQ